MFFIIVMLNVYRHYDDFHTPVIQSGGKNALWERWENGCVMRSDESITLVTSYWLSSSRVQILHIRSGCRLAFSVIVALSPNRHSELWQEYRMRKQGGSNMIQSEESVTLMTAYHPCQSCDCCLLLKK
ncbi:hypothetical protein, partial [Dialister invisus]|uniref:hypothetical protein n=1 Tax=Dialister invisus TaxID=218538 RepID=UPI003AB80065